MGWGLFMKLVIASRLSIVANLVYDNHTEANPVQLILGTFAYALQIYCDFASYSELAIGSAQCMGFKLRDNFFQPFFATSSAELWRRWHMSLMSWFKDYLYIPLGGSRKGRLRKYVNILIVFTLSGLWHGAAWTYVLWGFLSGLFQVTGEILKKYRERIVELWPLKGRLAGLLHHGIKVLLTVFFFNVSLVFFRAKSISQAAEILKAVFTGFSFSDITKTNVFELGLGYINLGILAFSLLILFVVDLARERGREPQKLLTGLSPALRWAAYYGMILMILLSTNIGAQRFILKMSDKIRLVRNLILLGLPLLAMMLYFALKPMDYMSLEYPMWIEEKEFVTGRVDDRRDYDTLIIGDSRAKSEIHIIWLSVERPR